MIYCYAGECIHSHNGFCSLNEITISYDYHQCDDYIDYQDSEEYQSEFYRAVIMDGVIYKRKDKGKRAEENGIVFYYWSKELEPESRIIEEQTGRMTTYSRLNQLPNIIDGIIKEQGKVVDLPEWSEENEK